jgi:heme exporter protein B
MDRKKLTYVALAAVGATSAAVLGNPGYFAEFWRDIAVGAGYDAIMLLAAFGLYEFVIGA